MSPAPRVELIGAFESAYQPEHDTDVMQTTEHDLRWREDLELLRSCGVRRLRYPVRWHIVERERGVYDWRISDEVFAWMRDHDMHPIVDLVHHASHPRWLDRGFADPGFGPALLRYYEAFALRYPWVETYTLFNEPFTTFFLAGSEAVFPPYLSGMRGFIALVRNVFPAVTAGSRMLRDLLPQAKHVDVDTCERHSAAAPAGEEYAAYANDRRFFMTDLFLGVNLTTDRPFVRDVLAHGGDDLLGIEPGYIDTLGLDYYAHSQWQFSGPGIGAGTSPAPGRLDDLICEYAERYGIPVALGETNIRGHCSDRASWFKYTLEQCHAALDRGVDIEWYCWFPTIDSCDWVSLLRRCDCAVDPVGVFWLDERMDRRESSMSHAFRLAAAGAAPQSLSAYRFRPPVSGWVRGYAPQMAHWQWLPPQDEPACTNAPEQDTVIEFPASSAAPEPPPGAAYEQAAV